MTELMDIVSCFFTSLCLLVGLETVPSDAECSMKYTKLFEILVTL